MHDPPMLKNYNRVSEESKSSQIDDARIRRSARMPKPIVPCVDGFLPRLFEKDGHFVWKWVEIVSDWKR